MQGSELHHTDMQTLTSNRTLNSWWARKYWMMYEYMHWEEMMEERKGLWFACQTNRKPSKGGVRRWLDRYCVCHTSMGTFIWILSAHVKPDMVANTSIGPPLMWGDWTTKSIPRTQLLIVRFFAIEVVLWFECEMSPIDSYVWGFTVWSHFWFSWLPDRTQASATMPLLPRWILSFQNCKSKQKLSFVRDLSHSKRNETKIGCSE